MAAGIVAGADPVSLAVVEVGQAAYVAVHGSALRLLGGVVGGEEARGLPADALWTGLSSGAVDPAARGLLTTSRRHRPHPRVRDSAGGSDGIGRVLDSSASLKLAATERTKAT
ncbi:hypothetical protein [Salinispora tropica]|uniref:hypothetical protein n=1 Tax=Salinispora tropica TaxID=168695 RepID=UPI0012D2DB90|nr:hypothetical protein [Salinispora tropica]